MRKTPVLPTLVCCAVAATPALAQTAPTGVWKKHEYSFVSMGFTSTYSCDGLADKLKVLLLAAGARMDIKSSPGACARGFGVPDKLARADVIFYSLVPTTGESADGAPLTARWVPVDLQPHKPRELGIGDCELVEQFRTVFLPMFTTRAIDNRTSCIPHQDSGSVFDLKFETLSAVTTPKHEP